MNGDESILTRRGFVSGSVVALVVPVSLPACEGKRARHRDVEASTRENAKGGGVRAPSGKSGKVAGQPPAPARAFPKVAAILPGEVDGYRPDGEDGHYGRDTLFDHINGGAEVFLALNVRAVVSRHYKRPESPELLVDVFDMGSARDALGAFHHDMREGESASIGRESELGSASLFFWKDRYFVSVVAFARTPKSRPAVVAMGKAVAAKIQNLGEIPEIVGLLPPRGLVTSQVHYFHTWQLLNHHYDFGRKNLFGLGKDTEGVLARYRHPDAKNTAGTSALLVIRYPSADRAEKARQRFVAGFLSGAETEISRTSKGWAGLRRRDDLLVGVFDASSRKQVDELLAAVDHSRKGAKK